MKMIRIDTDSLSADYIQGISEVSGSWQSTTSTVASNSGSWGGGATSDTLYIDAGSFTPCTTNGASAGTKEYATDKPELDYFAFDGGATEERVQFKTLLPGWDASPITAKFYWSSDTGSTSGDTVELAIKAVALNDSTTLATAFGSGQVISDILLLNNGAGMQITPSTPALTVGGTPASGSMVSFEVYRNTDGTDNMTEDLWLFGVELTYGLN